MLLERATNGGQVLLVSEHTRASYLAALCRRLLYSKDKRSLPGPLQALLPSRFPT